MEMISDESVEMMIPCFKPVTKFYAKGEKILEYEFNMPKRLAMVIAGTAKLEIFNDKGGVFLLESYSKDDVFGDLFAMPLQQFFYTITATSDCVVMYLDYEHIISPCENLCAHHSQLISNLFMMTAQKAQALSLHISILAQPTTRDKLLAYLKYQCAQSGICSNGCCTFQIPMSLSKLAEYLNVDRAAMMRELKSMKDEGILDSNRRIFKMDDSYFL